MKKETLILISFIALKFILQYFLISPEYDLQRDEYLHLDQANHLAWGFQSVPPFTSWISYLILLLGNSFFWIKFFPALFGALTIYIVWKAIEELNGNLFALILGTTCVLFSALLRLNTLYQPNSFDALSWTSVYFILIKYFKTENTKWLFVASIVFALGFLNKYNILFLLFGLFPAIMLTEQRKIFLQPKLYVALLVAFLMVIPNLFWQYKNHFPVVHHMNDLAKYQLINVNRFNFLKSQILFFIGSISVIFSAFYALLFYKPFKQYRFFFWSIIFTLIAFIYFKAKDYYAIGIYPIYISFGAVFIGNILQDSRKKYLKPVFIIIPAVFFIPFYQIGFPNKKPEYIIQHQQTYRELGLLRWEDGKDHKLPQDFADMLGWKELAYKVDSIYLNLPNKEKTVILCDNFGQAGAINYYSQQSIKAVSFNADYINWFDLTKKYENMIRVKSNDVETELETTSQFFQNSKLVTSIKNIYAREFGTTIFVFKDAKIDIRERLKEEIEEEKNYR